MSKTYNRLLRIKLNKITIMKNIHILPTNNPSIDIGQVIDEVEELADKWVFKTNGHKWSNNDDTAGDNYSSFIEGYNTHSQTHSLSDDEVVEFNIWCNKPSEEDIRQPNTVYIPSSNFYWHKHKKYTPKELLQLFKEQQIKTIYYE